MLRRNGARTATLAVVIMAMVGGIYGVIPVRSQSVSLQAMQTETPIPVEDPWAEVWESAPSLRVPLSAQNVSPPFGGGTVDSVTARALHDGQTLFLLVEWNDDDVADSVVGGADFSDAAAVQFPSSDGVAPYTMGGPDAPVNIWQWKAVWQADIEAGFAGAQSLYPDTFVDFYPDDTDSINNPARHLGNPLAQSDHPSPVENLVAEGFGTLTSSAVQDVGGRGVWADGKWRALFVRSFDSPAEGAANFATGETSSIAFAVWDGNEGDRNGQKSIAQFIELEVAAEQVVVAPGEIEFVEESGIRWYPALFALLAAAALFVFAEWTVRRARSR